MLGETWWLGGRESTCQGRGHRFDPWVRKIPWRRKWQPTPVFLPGKSRGQRSLVGYSPQGCNESDTTEHSRISSIIVETSRTPGHDFPLQHKSNPRFFQRTRFPGGLIFHNLRLCIYACLHSLEGSTLDSEDVFYPNSILPNLLHL